MFENMSLQLTFGVLVSESLVLPLAEQTKSIISYMFSFLIYFTTILMQMYT
jgi:hypothetical protein